MLQMLAENWWIFAVGLYLAIFPGPGLLSLAWLVGFWAVVFGVINLVLAFRLRGMGQGRQAARTA